MKVLMPSTLRFSADNAFSARYVFLFLGLRCEFVLPVCLFSALWGVFVINLNESIWLLMFPVLTFSLSVQTQELLNRFWVVLAEAVA